MAGRVVLSHQASDRNRHGVSLEVLGSKVSISMKTFRLRIARRPGTDRISSVTLAVPLHLAELIPQDQEFVPELTDDGLLYRPAESPKIQEIAPTWARRP